MIEVETEAGSCLSEGCSLLRGYSLLRRPDVLYWGAELAVEGPAGEGSRWPFSLEWPRG